MKGILGDMGDVSKTFNSDYGRTDITDSREAITSTNYKIQSISFSPVVSCLPGVAVGELELLTELGGVMSYSSHITPVYHNFFITSESAMLSIKSRCCTVCIVVTYFSVQNDLPLLTLITVTATHFAHKYFSNLK